MMAITARLPEGQPPSIEGWALVRRLARRDALRLIAASRSDSYEEELQRVVSELLGDMGGEPATLPISLTYLLDVFVTMAGGALLVASEATGLELAEIVDSFEETLDESDSRTTTEPEEDPSWL